MFIFFRQGVNPDEYAFRLVRKIDNNETLMVIDVDKEIVVNTLDELDADKGGYVGIVIASGISGTISKIIAEQTNLISLNATIEAARVGKVGSGFAVIAKEIIAISNQSQDSAGQISKIVDEMLRKTNDVVKIAKEAFEMVKVQNQSVSGTKDVFEEMKANIDILLGSLEEITRNVVNMEGQELRL